jgi:hypothetical protein
MPRAAEKRAAIRGIARSRSVVVDLWLKLSAGGMDPYCFARQFGVISTLPPEAVVRIEHAGSSRSWVSLTGQLRPLATLK